jgi:hypothetical protein
VRLVSAVGFYAIVRGGKCTYLHNNLGAYEILEVSVAGPELTLRFLDAYHGWRTTVSTSGGVPTRIPTPIVRVGCSSTTACGFS